MEDFPDIISSNIIDQKWDAFWEDRSAAMPAGERQVLVLSLPFLPGSPEQVQLQRMLQACQLTEHQIHILQLEPEQLIAWHQIRDAIKPKQVILLGVTTEQLGLSVYLMPHQVSRFNDCIWIPTGSLELLAQQPEIKTHLWNYGLKPVFIDKSYD